MTQKANSRFTADYTYRYRFSEENTRVFYGVRWQRWQPPTPLSLSKPGLAFVSVLPATPDDQNGLLFDLTAK
ncbi:MAG: hypothetical protein AMXMBFR84_50540 [Candidatus Hydrogenedentota bacterium]